MKPRFNAKLGHPQIGGRLDAMSRADRMVFSGALPRSSESGAGVARFPSELAGLGSPANNPFFHLLGGIQ